MNRSAMLKTSGQHNKIFHFFDSRDLNKLLFTSNATFRSPFLVRKHKCSFFERLDLKSFRFFFRPYISSTAEITWVGTSWTSCDSWSPIRPSVRNALTPATSWRPCRDIWRSSTASSTSFFKTMNWSRPREQRPWPNPRRLKLMISTLNFSKSFRSLFCLKS